MRGLPTYFFGGVYKSSGAVLKPPYQTNYGMLKVVFVIAPSLLAGAYISKTGARFLEENEIFVPEEN